MALHHFRRYNRRSLVEVIPRDAFEVVHINYVNVVAFPLVWLVRKWRALKAKVGAKVDSRSEDNIPPGPLNARLCWSFVWPACQSLIPFPIGVAPIAVLRRK